mmetsp:Transcript_9992/g.33319  ORF Transcript_9992/g.33319 Transcript_9992/m.33319 type:complete len:242 (-) Transcript_9992:18-743(-)
MRSGDGGGRVLSLHRRSQRHLGQGRQPFHLDPLLLPVVGCQPSKRIVSRRADDLLLVVLQKLLERVAVRNHRAMREAVDVHLEPPPPVLHERGAVGQEEVLLRQRLPPLQVCLRERGDEPPLEVDEVPEALGDVPLVARGVDAEHVLGVLGREAHEGSASSVLLRLFSVHDNGGSDVPERCYSLKNHPSPEQQCTITPLLLPPPPPPCFCPLFTKDSVLSKTTLRLSLRTTFTGEIMSKQA